MNSGKWIKEGKKIILLDKNFNKVRELPKIKIKNKLLKEDLELVYLALNDLQTMDIDLDKNDNKYYFLNTRDNLRTVLNNYNLNGIDDFDQQIEKQESEEEENVK